MKPTVDLPENAGKAVTLQQMDTYMAFKMAFPKPVSEDAHLRHILRFYVARALAKSGASAVLVRPLVRLDDQRLSVDVAASRDGRTVLAICEPAGVTAQTVAALDVLKDAEDTEVILVHSRFASADPVPARFAPQLASKAFRLMSVVPPPFDDVLEYDIWMFELTFREAMA
ncbi:MAG: hypothetical protein QN178_00665 [Armatimonadota bacterium]|nr:hypothetical protein [Armatimonadota bacterium]